MNQEVFQVELIAYKEGDYDNYFKTDVLWADNKSFKLIFELFKIIKNESQDLREDINTSNEPNKTALRVLINNHASDFDKKGDLEDVLLKKVDKLKKYKFYKGLIDISIEKIIEKLKSLRKRRIMHWERILKEYMENKVIFNKELDEYNKDREIKFKST